MASVEFSIVARDKIVTKLSAGTFTQTFTPVAKYVSEEEYDLGDDNTLHVPVIPGSREDETAGRCMLGTDIVVDVGVIKKLPAQYTNTDVDAMMNLVHEITMWLSKASNHNLGDGYAFQSLAIDPIYSTDHLRNHGVFLSVVRVRIAKGTVNA